MAAFLATLEDPGTRRNYAGTLRAWAARFGSDAPLVTLEDPHVAGAVAAWFTERWGDAAPATFNRNLDTLRSAVRYWMEQDWLAADPTSGLRRRRRAADRTRALSRAEIDELLARDDIALREKTLWRMLYETAAPANEVLSLDGGDLDVRNRKAEVRRKGGAVDVIVWQTATARLLPRLLEGRRTGGQEPTPPRCWPIPGTPRWRPWPVTPGSLPKPWPAGSKPGTRPGVAVESG